MIEWGWFYPPIILGDYSRSIIRLKVVDDRKDVWSLSATKNWRITFRSNRAGDKILDLDYEDYY